MLFFENERDGGWDILQLVCVVRSATITGRWSLSCSRRTPDIVEWGGTEQKTWSITLLAVGVGWAEMVTIGDRPKEAWSEI